MKHLNVLDRKSEFFDQHYHTDSGGLRGLIPGEDTPDIVANTFFGSNHGKATFKLKPDLCRDKIYQCAAAIYQVRPNSALFKLPVLIRADVQEWMKTTYPADLCVLQAAAGSPVDMARIADAALRQSLEEMRAQLSS